MTNNSRLDEEMSPQKKRAMLAQLLREKAGGTKSYYSLSYEQRAMWFQSQLMPDSSAYNLAEAIKIKGDLDISTMRIALQQVVARHLSLQVTFTTRNGTPVQEALSQNMIQMIEQDASNWSSQQLSDRLSESVNQPFHLENDPLLRVILYKQSEHEHLLLFVLHHIAGEFWSLVIVLNELFELYQAAKSGELAALPPLNLQYRDFIQWQQDMLESIEGERHWNYWQKQLSGDIPLLNLPIDHHRPDTKSDRGAMYAFKLDPDLANRLKEVSKSEGVTLYVFLLAAFKVLLHRYTSQDDIVCGSPMTIRGNSAWANVVGIFMNNLPLRSNLAENPPFSDFLVQIRRTVLEAFEHQAYPFSLIVERLQPERNSNRSPLYDVNFVFRKSQLSDMQNLAAFSMGNAGVQINLGNGLILENVNLKLPHAQFDLTLIVADANGEIHASWQYSTDLFDETTIARMSAHFLTLLKGITANTKQSILTLPLMNETECHQMLVDWNITKTRSFSNQLIHQPFEVQVQQSPTAVAVIASNRQITYKELDQKANQVAHWLRQKGACPNMLVAVVMEKGWEQIVAVLGIVKSGAAYLPIDPKLPQERVWHLLNRGDISLVLTQQWIDESLEWPTDLQRLQVRDETLADLDNQLLSPSQHHNDLAYVIFTSGSTGVPKGVMIDHQGAVNTICDINERFALSANDRVLALSSLSFDLSVYDIFGTLAVGAALVLPEATRMQDPAYWAELVAQKQVTIWNSVPRLLQLLLDYVSDVPNSTLSLQSLRIALLSGDWIPLTLPDHFRTLVPKAQAIGLGGATEASIWSVLYEIKAVDPSWISIPYGRAMANQQLYILNSEFELCPIGVAGELYIGGIGLAKGYWKDRQKTIASFITHPHTLEPLYRTGDMGRYFADGTIEFLGRLDSQVKIRGFRVELGEVEAALGQHKAVKLSVVTVNEDHGRQHLVAYIVPQPTADITSGELRRFLDLKLPHYMIPSSFVFLDAIPLNDNGKVDKKALPIPLNHRPEISAVFAAPHTPTEKILTKVWANVIGIDRVGIHDNFFELGGDSISSIQVSIQALQNGLQFSPRQLFEHPTVRQLATVAQPAQVTMTADIPAKDLSAGVKKEYTTADFPFAHLNLQQLKQIQANYPQVEDIYPLGPMQETMFFHSLYESTPEIYCEQVLCDLHGHLDVSAFERAWQQIIARYPSLRAAFILDGCPRPLQVIQQNVDLKIEHQDWSNLSLLEYESQLVSFLQNDRARGFDFYRAPLMRMTLVRLSEETYKIIWSHHHILFDGWSLYLVIKEFLTIYEGIVTGQETLTHEKFSFANYIDWLNHQDYEVVEQFWRKELQGFTSATQLRLEQPVVNYSEFKHKEQHIQLSVEETEQLTVFARQHHLTLSTVFQGAWTLLLNRYSGEIDVAFGVTVSGRPETLVGIESMVGLFINTLPLRVQISSEDTILDLLKCIQDKQVKLREFGYTPLQQIQRWSNLSQHSEQFGLFKSILVFENFPVDKSLLNQCGNLHISHIDFLEQTNTPITVYVMPGKNFSIRITYDERQFSSLTITRLLKHLSTLLKNMVTLPATSCFKMPMLTEAEQHQFMEWNNIQATSVPTQCIHKLFEEQVTRTPDAIAVEFEKQQLTYQELNHKANQLAYYLKAQGVKPDMLVGIFVERSVEMIIGLLGILKAGGAYVPLDPSYPSERIMLVLQDAQISILVTQQRLVEQIPTYQAQSICIDQEWERIAQENSHNPTQELTNEHLAYVIYTSGTTGNPKGVMISHQALVNYTEVAGVEFAINSSDRILQFASVSFDAAAEEIFPCLTRGATLVLRTDLMLDSIVSFIESCQDWNLTVLDLPTAYWHELVIQLSASSLELPPSVRLVIIGGESALPERVLLWQNLVGQRVRLLNTYGPTETTIAVTMSDLSDPEVAIGQNVPIGFPIRNIQTYVLDCNLQPVPVEIPGELYIGGVGIAKGYLNHPQLTQEKFIPNPFFDDVGSRLYKTGDIARYRSDGNIEFLGRLDYQVKIRGFRIELGEIESVLSTHPRIQQAIVIAIEDSHSNTRLIAYVVSEEEALNSQQLREFIQQKLPNYMVPSAFFILESLPLTPNGKIDRKALPIIDVDSKHKREYVAPRTEIEQIIVNIFSEVLAIEVVSINDNFFELGGHSLLAIQVMSRLRQSLQLELSLRVFLDAPNVAKLAEYCSILISTVSPLEISENSDDNYEEVNI